MRHSLDKKIYIGTMSGTSYDGIDICSLNADNQISLLKFSSFKYPSLATKEIYFLENLTSDVIKESFLRIYLIPKGRK